MSVLNAGDPKTRQMLLDALWNRLVAELPENYRSLVNLPEIKEAIQTSHHALILMTLLEIDNLVDEDIPKKDEPKN